LNDILGTLLNDVIRDPRLQEFSVASNVSSEQREQNIRYIQTVAKNFLDAIVGSANSFPPYVLLSNVVDIRPLRQIFHHIAVCAAERFRGNTTAPHIGVGSIVFLRFIGPAISIPASSIQPNEELPPGIKRALVLVTKIIQNLASNAPFTEQNMISLNAFLEANIKRVLEFIRTISACPATPSTTSASSHVNEVPDADVLRLYDFVYNNLTDVKKSLHQMKSGEDTLEAGRARVHLLTTLTSQLGSSARKEASNGQEQLPVQISASVNIGDYSEFMERFKGRNIETFNSARIFYVAGTSKVNLIVALLIQATSASFMFCYQTL
jgi:neurofibromin 1